STSPSFHRVIRITEGVSATANEVSEEEKLRKLCGLLCECSKIARCKLKESPPQRMKCATANEVSEEEKLRRGCG
ncbi:MAG: hypothetical protein PHV12_07390, partial [Bacteroidales bacterium]|nr:hypothetical protein [Bacteroidales bacterium]